MPATNTQACVKQVASKDSMEPAVVKCAEDARNVSKIPGFVRTAQQDFMDRIVSSLVVPTADCLYQDNLRATKIPERVQINAEMGPGERSATKPVTTQRDAKARLATSTRASVLRYAMTGISETDVKNVAALPASEVNA